MRDLKATTDWDFKEESGGGGGIRTHVRVSPVGLKVHCLRPLGNAPREGARFSRGVHCGTSYIECYVTGQSSETGQI